MKKNKKIVFISGRFNVLHPGHLRLLRFGKDSGDHLIVGVESDRMAGNAAHVHERFRLEGVLSNSLVDEAFIFDEPIEELLSRLQPTIVVKGREHEQNFNPEVAVVKAYGGSVLFSSGETIFSSIDLIRKEFQGFNPALISVPTMYLERHGVKKNRIRKLIEKFASLKICVVGDLIIDEYITCQALGMSQEDPTIVVTPLDSAKFVGGAGIVAGHAAGLGASVDLMSIVGNDEIGVYAKKALQNLKVNAQLTIDENRPTTLKQRFRSKGKTLLRVSHLHQGDIASELEDQIFDSIKQIVKEVDLLVFSDFNYGCLPQSLVDRIVSLCKAHNVYLAADSQSSSQVGDIGRFKEINLLTPTEHEARISMRNREDGLVVLAETLRVKTQAENILLKLGEEGLLIHANQQADHNWLTDRIDALNTSPRDVSGAGDSLLITASMALASGATIWEAAYLGSLAAAIQVGRVGNTPLSVAELIQELN